MEFGTINYTTSISKKYIKKEWLQDAAFRNTGKDSKR